MFSLIPNKNVQKTVFSSDPFRRDLPATILYVVPIKDLKQMTMSWVIPDFSHKYDSNPPNYLSHLGK
jgi:secreted Zn-dependent insulinase-like peptidase